MELTGIDVLDELNDSLNAFNDFIFLSRMEIRDDVLIISWSSMSEDWIKGREKMNRARIADFILSQIMEGIYSGFMGLG